MRSSGETSIARAGWGAFVLEPGLGLGVDGRGLGPEIEGLNRELVQRLVVKADRGRLDVGSSDHELRRVCLGGKHRLRGIGARVAGRGPGGRGRRPACHGGSEVFGGAPQRAAGLDHAGTGEAQDAGQSGATDQNQPGDEQEHGQDVGADGREQVRDSPQLGLADHAAAALKARRMPEQAGGHRSRAEAERSGGQGQGQCRHQTQQSRPQGPGRRPQFADQDQAAGRDQASRDRVAQGAEHEASGAHGAVSERPACPVGVGHAAQEETDRDQGQPQDVDVVGLGSEMGKPGPRGQQ